MAGSTLFSRLFPGLVSAAGPVFRLVDVPLVYHVLPKQGVGIRRPSMTNAQRDFATAITNKHYNIYDKQSKKSVQFASFVTNQTIVHADFVSKSDCSSLSYSDLAAIVMQAVNWQFKFHAIVCEFAQISGVATFPTTYQPSDPLHNVFRLDHRALACFDDVGDFLCNLTNGQNVSYSRWWRTQSSVLAHEMGHLFGLYHTFQGGCASQDQIADTPAESDLDTKPFGCPGLLPYDKDRNLIKFSQRKNVNAGGTAGTCGSVGDICGATCAACCTPPAGSSTCDTFLPGSESISQNSTTFPNCCNNDPRPRNTCRLGLGIDPLNNIMSYAPDFCSYEFTPGQLSRMMAQTRMYKTIIYCNYADVADNANCKNVPCFAAATSPNCA